MPYTVEQLFNDRESIISPTGIEQTASIEEALIIMLRKQFSQLPVVDKDYRLLGEYAAYMVTNESILRALRNLNTVPAKLRVSDAMVRVRAYRLEDQLSDLLKDLRDTYGVPIMGDKRHLVGVVTSYDTTEYFRKRAEDMMHIERIEKKLKEYILIYFTNPSGEINEDALNAAISDSMPSNRKELRGPFDKGLKCYLELSGDISSSINTEIAKRAFEEHIYSKSPTLPFAKLSFDDYIKLFVHETRWVRYRCIFQRESKEMQKLLADIRDIRNALAHFRSETITDEQRDKIYFCEAWLESFHTAVMEEFQPSSSSEESANSMEPVNVPPLAIQPLADTPSIEVLHLAEEKPSDSRYAPLALWLQEQLPSERAIKLAFPQIEAIIGDKLPESAHERSWWANDSKGHVQSQQWLEVGWRISRIDLREETVTFSRIKEREKGYIDFYSGLLQKLTKAAEFPVKQASPDGLNWIIIGRAPSVGLQVGFLGYSFARHGRFRAEFYIDCGNKERNKFLYDKLYMRKNVIQAELADLSGSLEWERIDEKRACRIAIYQNGAITDSIEKLAELHEWAQEAMIRFQSVLDKHVSEIV
jgi:CBS domain-containing protein